MNRPKTMIRAHRISEASPARRAAHGRRASVSHVGDRRLDARSGRYQMLIIARIRKMTLARNHTL